MTYSLWIDGFTTMDPDQSGGKSLFCYRLGRCMQDQGMMEVTDDRTRRVDFSLNVIQIHNPNARKKILRLDGVWHDTGKDYKAKNVGMQRALRNCDAVVYQSQFAKRMADTFLGKPDVPTAVIPNGTNLNLYPEAIPFQHDGPVFLAVSKWRPHKRLEDTIEAFLLAAIPNALLVIAGDLSKSGVSENRMRQYHRNPSLRFVGHVPQYALANLMKAAYASIHLCWFDACPNSVVEALSFGVPVITNNVGGTRELVELATFDSRLICEVDQPYNLEPVDLYHPPKIDRRKIAQAIRLCHDDVRPTVNRQAVSIERVASQYHTFMEGLL